MKTESEAAPPNKKAKKKLLLVVLKIAVGIGIFALIASKLSLDDTIQLKDGTIVRGRRLSFDRSAASLQVVHKDGLKESIPFSRDPVILIRGNDIAFREHLGPIKEVSEAALIGSARIEIDGTVKDYPLQALALANGPNEGEWVEQLPEMNEGLLTIFGRLSLPNYSLALLLILATYLFGVKRWQILLRAQGIDVSLFEATRLTFIGFFFNNALPGLTGGDIVKAYMIAKAHPGRGAVAVSTVIVDRVLGLLVLAAISAVFLLFHFNEYRTVATWLFICLGAALVAIALFLSRRVRRALRIDLFLRRLPGSGALRALDHAFLDYRSKGRAIVWSVLLSVASHLVNILSIYLMGMDLGVDETAGLTGKPLVTYYAIVPTILILSSVPLLPGGWGLGEALYAYFFRTVGVSNLSLSVGLSVLTRASMLLWSLVGGVFYFLRRREAEEAMRAAERDSA